MVKVKICGIKDESTALSSIEAGADFLGFNFSPTSKRKIDINDLSGIIGRIQKENTNVKIVFLFFKNTKEDINSTLKIFSPDYIQFVSHDDSVNINDLKTKNIPLLPQIGVKNKIDDTDLPDYSLMILDSFHKESGGGSGKTFPWENVKNIKKNFLLAGGLNPQNVKNAIEVLNPYGVDVASGVESEPGVKDIKLIKEFIKNAKGN